MPATETHIISNLSQARAAYEEVYGPYHGFLVRQIFQNSFDAAPPSNIILHHMNLPKLHDMNGADDSTMYDDDDDDDMWIHLPVDRESLHRLSITVNPAPHPFLNFVGSFVKEHLVKLGACIGMEGHAHPSLNALSLPKGSTSSLKALASSTSTAAVAIDTNAPDKDVASYLFSLGPFLQGLDNLMVELNLNDPSRV